MAKIRRPNEATYRGWRMRAESLGSIGPRVLMEAIAVKKGHVLRASVETESSGDYAEVLSVMRACVRAFEKERSGD